MLRLVAILISAGAALAMSLVGLMETASADATIDMIWVESGQSHISEVDPTSPITLRVILTPGPSGSIAAGVSVDYTEAVGKVEVLSYASTPSDPLPFTLGEAIDTGSRIENINAYAFSGGLAAGQSFQLGTVTFRQIQPLSGTLEITVDANGPYDNVLDGNGNVVTDTTTFNSAFIDKAPDATPTATPTSTPTATPTATPTTTPTATPTVTPTVSVVLDFEGLADGEPIANFYNGGIGGNGSGPGPDLGVTFTNNAVAYIKQSASGTAPFDGEPSPVTAMFATTDTAPIMNVPAGFDTGFSMYYAATFVGRILVYDGLNSTGQLLADLPLPITGATFSSFVPIGIAFEGTARSVELAGVRFQIGFDNITLGSVIPSTESPSPTPTATPTATPTPTPTAAPTATPTPTPATFYKGSLILHTRANDQVVGTGFPFSQKFFIARPLGARCNPANGGLSCGTETLQKGAPLVGSGTVDLYRGLSPPGFALPASALRATAMGSLPQYTPYDYVSTYATNAHNYHRRGGFGPGFGPGKRTITFLGNDGPGARVTISPGAHQFGGTMRILGAMGAKRTHIYRNKKFIGTGFASFGVLGDECTLTCYVTGAQSNFQSLRYQTAMGKATTADITTLGLPWTTGMVSITATDGPFPTLFRRTGYDNRTAMGLGTIQLVAPQLTQWKFPNRSEPWDRHTGVIGILRIKFIPEPSGMAMFVAGAVLIRLFYRLRARD